MDTVSEWCRFTSRQRCRLCKGSLRDWYLGQSTTFLPESTAHMHVSSVMISISMREVFPWTLARRLCYEATPWKRIAMVCLCSLCPLSSLGNYPLNKSMRRRSDDGPAEVRARDKPQCRAQASLCLSGLPFMSILGMYSCYCGTLLQHT